MWGRPTIPLGINLTARITSVRSTPTPKGSRFAFASETIPFGGEYSWCEPAAIVLPMDLGGVYFRGDTCPLAPGSHVADVTLKLPPALPLGQLKLLGIDQSRSGVRMRARHCTRIRSSIAPPQRSLGSARRS